MRRRLLAALFLPFLSVACSSAATPTPTPADPPISFAPCGDLASPKAGSAVLCGSLDVPEVHAAPGGAHLALRVIVTSAGNGERDPLVFLQGGPGGTVEDLARSGWSGYLANTLQRDVILLEQRGDALSTPALDCKLGDEASDLGKALGQCAADYAARGTRLEAFNTIESAHDVEALRRALGRSTLAVWGVSYGALLAATVVREHPTSVSSLVLEASMTNERIYRDLDRQQRFPATLDAFMRWLGATCASNARCAAAMPGLDPAAELRATVERAKAAPITLADGIVIDSEATLRRTFLLAMYATPIAVLLVRMLYADNRGELDAFDASVRLGGQTPREALRSAVAFPGVQPTVELVVNCYDLGRNWTDEGLAAELDGLGEQGMQRAADLAGAAEFRRVCEALPPPTVEQPRFPTPVASDVPTLFLGATLDATTPIAWARDTQRLLPRSQVVEVPCMGHGVVLAGGACTVGIMGAFLDDPAKPVDTSCLVARCSGVAIEPDLFYEDRFK